MHFLVGTKLIKNVWMDCSKEYFVKSDQVTRPFIGFW